MFSPVTAQISGGPPGRPLVPLQLRGHPLHPDDAEPSAGSAAASPVASRRCEFLSRRARGPNAFGARNNGEDALRLPLRPCWTSRPYRLGGPVSEEPGHWCVYLLRPAAFFPAPDRRPADTTLPNGVIEAAFQAVSSFNICLNKRTQHQGPTRLYSTNGNRVFAIIFHRYLPHKSVNPVSGLRVKYRN